MQVITSNSKKTFPTINFEKTLLLKCKQMHVENFAYGIANAEE